VAGAHEHSAPVGLRVVNAVGDGQAVGLRAKIMILYQNGFAIPLGTGVLEVAHLLYVRNTNRNWLTLLARSDEKVEEAGCCIARRRANL